MGEWVIGAFINIFGSLTINFGTNLLKLGHEQRERLSLPSSEESNGKLILKPIIHFQTWRVGILFFALGNCLNFISFAYAAQSLLAALGSVQFVSNIAFAYFVLSKTVTVKVMVATVFIVLGNIFLVSFGNHQSPVYTPEQLTEKFSNLVFLLYCLTLVLIVAVSQYMYRSNMLRLTMGSNYQLHTWFTYSMLLLFFSTAGFWMARLNEGLSLFDAILIVPMFQIAWTFFSICTGFIYFQEYQVFDTLRITMFLLGMTFVFIGISLLAPDDSKGTDTKDTSCLSPSAIESLGADINRVTKLPAEENEITDLHSLAHSIVTKAKSVISKTKAACSLSLGLGEESMSASSVLVMPMVSSSRTTGFRGANFNRAKFIPLRNTDWSNPAIDDDNDDAETRETRSLLL